MGLITKKEAGEILNRPERTIRDWIRQGVLKVHKVKRNSYVDSDTVYALRDTEADIDHALAERKAVYNEVKAAIDEMRKENYFKKGMVRTAVREMVNALGITSLSSREQSVFMAVLKGQSIESIAEGYGIYSIRVVQIFTKAVNKLLRGAKSYSHMLNEHIEMKDEIEKLKTLNASKDMMLNEYRKELNIKFSEGNDVRILNKRLADCDLEYRALRILKSYDIETVGQLIQLDRRQVCFLPQLGKKTMMNLDDFVESIGKSWGNKWLVPVYNSDHRVIRFELTDESYSQRFPKKNIQKL